MRKLICLVAVLMLSACENSLKELPRPTEPGLSDCRMFRRVEDFTAIYILRCPNSSTGVRTEYQQGKSRRNEYSTTEDL